MVSPVKVNDHDKLRLDMGHKCIIEDSKFELEPSFSRLLTYYLNYDRSIRLDSLNCFGIPTNKTKSGKIHYHHPNTTQENVSVLCTSHAEAYLALNNSPRDSFANIGVRAVRERTYQK